VGILQRKIVLERPIYSRCGDNIKNGLGELMFYGMGWIEVVHFRAPVPGFLTQCWS
jgi:hypothetical protein